MVAGGLITEVGGMMTHGSVVTANMASQPWSGFIRQRARLKDGQRVRIDGTAGKIIVLE